ncbi:uncharacterized protein METZ01_LOCUS86911, partial [marine metagenome]
VPVQQGVRGDDHPGGAESALHRSGVEESLLNRIEGPVVAEALDGHDLGTVRLASSDEAGADEFAVEVDGARPAFALFAGIFRTA